MRSCRFRETGPKQFADKALARGKHQAVELARQCWDELADQGFPEEDIAPLAFRPWYEAVLKWAIAPMEPNRMCQTPRPEEFVAAPWTQIRFEADRAYRYWTHYCDGLATPSLRAIMP